MARHLGILLHCHIPWVLGEGVWPHGLHWLHQAAADSYLPLWEELSQAEGQVTVSFTPVLVRQLENRQWQADFNDYLEEQRDAARRDETEFRRADRGTESQLARFWADLFEKRRRQFAEMDRDLVGAFRRLAAQGRVEIMTSSATHGILPLLPDGSRRAQVGLGASVSQAAFGRPARGFWLPECSYRPSLEDDLDQAGIGYTMLDTGLLRSGNWVGPYAGGGYEEEEGSSETDPPATHPHIPPVGDLSPYRPYLFPNAKTAFFVRDPRTALQVWSREHGYPGEPSYLEFHKRRDPGGHRYWRVTGHHCGLAYKELYNPDAATAALGRQAEHFVALANDCLGYEAEGILVAPFDAELFGHWWFEGPRWLGEVLRRWPSRDGNRATGLGDYLTTYPPKEVFAPPAGSWGEGGDFGVWDNPETQWIWEAIREGDHQVAAMGVNNPAKVQAAAQELLLLEASDWPFCLHTGQAVDYALKRLEGHRRRLASGDLDREVIFPEINPGWWQG